MNKHMINWDYFNPRFWIYRLWWWIMGDATVQVPLREEVMVVEYGHPLWYDVGAQRVAVITDDPMWVYGPWLEQNVGQRNRDWHMIMYINDNHTPEIELQFRKGKSDWANVATLKWAN